jgi:hypothetical protein
MKQLRMKKTIAAFTLLIVGFYVEVEAGAPERSYPEKFILVNGVDATHESFNEVASVFGKTTDHEIAVGVGFIISYFRMSPTEAASKLKKYLSLSEEFDLPVIVQLDGEQW